MMRRPPRATLLFLLLLAPLLRGCQCGCGRGPAISPEFQNKLRAQLQSRQGEAASPETPEPSAADDPFSLERRRIEFWEAYEQKKYAYVIADAIALLNAGVDEETQCELWLILSEAYGQMGETERAKEALGKFKQLFEKLRKGDKAQADAKGRQASQAAMQNFLARRSHAAFVWPDGERRMSDVLWDKIKDAGPDEVLEERLEDQTPVLISKNPDKLLDKVRGPSGEDAAIAREPEHGFYYAIREQH